MLRKITFKINSFFFPIEEGESISFSDAFFFYGMIVVLPIFVLLMIFL